MNNQNDRTVLLTGATGFLGSHLAVSLAHHGYTVICLVRPRTGRQAQQRVRTALGGIIDDPAQLREILSGIQVYEATLEQADLGLSAQDSTKLREKTDAVIHCAAQTSFSSDGIDSHWNANVAATENLARFACAAQHPPQFHYISTAYVAGNRSGTVYEHELDAGQDFYNNYEKTKFHAEKMLHGYRRDRGLNVTVYRPSIIVGDSFCGRTVNFNGMYLFMRFLQAAKQSCAGDRDNGTVHLPVRGVGNPETLKNFVHIDYVAKTIMAVFMHKEAHGETYHITHDHPPTVGLIQNVITDMLHISGTRFVSEETFRKNPPNELEAMLHSQLKIYTPYLLHEPAFDRSAIYRALPAARIPSAPPMDRQALELLFSYALESNWGRKKITPGKNTAAALCNVN